MPTKEPYRPIFPSIWRDPRLKALRKKDRTLVEIYFYLTTGPATSPIGIYEICEMATHAGRLSLDEDTLLRGIGGVCHRYGWAIDYNDDNDKGIILLDGWWKEHPPASSTVAIHLLKHLDAIPDHPLKLRFLNSLTWIPERWEATQRRIACLTEGYLRGIGGVSDTPEHTVTETVTDTVTDTSACSLEDQKQKEQTAKIPTTPGIDKLINDPKEGVMIDWLDIVLERYRIEDESEFPPRMKFQLKIEQAEEWANLYSRYGKDGLEIAVCCYWERTGVDDFKKGRRSINNCLSEMFSSFGGHLTRALQELKDRRESESETETEKSPPAPISDDLLEVWNDASEKIREHISDEDFGTWFDSVWLSQLGDGTATLLVPSNFRAETLEAAYNDLLVEILSGIAGEPVQIVYEITGHVGGARK